MKFRKLLISAILIGILFSTAAFAADGSSDAKETVSYADPADFAGKTVAMVIGGTAESILAEHFPDAIPAYYSSSADSVMAVVAGKADAVLSDDVVLYQSIVKDPSLRLIPVNVPPDRLAPIFQKNEKGEALAAQYNEFLAAYKAGPEYEKDKTKWIAGTDGEKVFDDPSDIPDVNGTLVIATTGSIPPASIIVDGEIRGFEVEIMREFCRAYGYRPEFVTVDLSAIITGVTTGKFDIGSTGFSITEERKKSVLFGDPYLDVRVSLMVKDAEASAQESFFDQVSAGFQRTFLAENRWQMFVSGILTTVLITVLSIVLGTLAGFGLYLLCRNGDPAVNRVTGFFRWFITGMPVVVFLMVLFYVVFAKSSLSGEAVAVVGFALLFGFSVFDMLKNGEAAIEEGQKEAAYALGYGNLDTYLRIIFPQALRHILPVYESEVVSLLKATAVVGYVAVVDLTKVGDLIRGRTYDAFFPLLAVVAGYFLISAVMKWILHRATAIINSGSAGKMAFLTAFIKEE